MLENQFSEMRSHYDTCIQETLAQLWREVDDLKLNSLDSKDAAGHIRGKDGFENTSGHQNVLHCCEACSVTLSEHQKRLGRQSATIADLEAKYRKLKQLVMRSDAGIGLGDISMISTVDSPTQVGRPLSPIGSTSQSLKDLTNALHEYVTDVANAFEH